MKVLIAILCTFCTTVVVGANDIDLKYLRCLVCRATVHELEAEVAKVDPTKEVTIGGYRMDADGNTIRRKVLQVRSEVYISELLDQVCEKMNDYVRARYKMNGRLTLLHLMTPDGNMNPEISEVDIIQDEDLNKSLKFYCEGIVDEYESSIIELFVAMQSNKKWNLCTRAANLCGLSDFHNEENNTEAQGANPRESDEL